MGERDPGSDTPSDAPLSVQADGPLTLVRLQRPRRRNALDLDTLRAFEALLEQGLLPGTAILTIEGAGGTFCSGADLKALAAADAEERAQLTRLGQAVFRRLERLPVLSVALVEGYCLG